MFTHEEEQKEESQARSPTLGNHGVDIVASHLYWYMKDRDERRVIETCDHIFETIQEYAAQMPAIMISGFLTQTKDGDRKEAFFRHFCHQYEQHCDQWQEGHPDLNILRVLSEFDARWKWAHPSSS